MSPEILNPELGIGKIPCMIVNVIVTQHHRRPSTQISRKPVVLVCCGRFWVVLVGFVGFVGGFGWFCSWFWVVLAGSVF